MTNLIQVIKENLLILLVISLIFVTLKSNKNTIVC